MSKKIQWAELEESLGRDLFEVCKIARFTEVNNQYVNVVGAKSGTPYAMVEVWCKGTPVMRCETRNRTGRPLGEEGTTIRYLIPDGRK